MKIIAVVGQKGGVGKTTISVNLALGLVRMGYRVMLVDADPQASAGGWYKAREETEEVEEWPQVFASVVPTMHQKGQLRSVQGVDVVVIDGPPQHDEMSRSALHCADLALLPVSPSALDVKAIARTVNLVREVQNFNEGLRAALVVSRKQPNTKVGRRILRSLEGVEGIPPLKSQLTLYVGVAESPTHGKSIFAHQPDSKAAKEFHTLTREVVEILGLEDNANG